MLKLKETGTMRRMKTKSLIFERKPEYKFPIAVKLSLSWYIFAILVCGLLVAVIACSLEIFIHWNLLCRRV